MTIECTNCGSFEVSESNFKDLRELPGDHWQIQYLRDGVGNVKGVAVISRANTDALQVGPLKSRLTKMDKRALRRQSEGKQQVVRHVFYIGKDDKTST